MALSRGITKAVEAVTVAISKQAEPIDVKNKKSLQQVATIAGNNDPSIGNVLADAFIKVGKDGVITVEEGRGNETTVEVVEGMQFDRGFLSPHFVTNEDDQTAELDGCLVLVYEEKISNAKALVPLLEAVSKAGKPLLIIAEDIEGEALATLVVNKLRGIVNVCAVKAPGYGDRRKAMLGDIATLTGATAIFKDLGIQLDGVQLSDLGKCRKVVISSDNTTMVSGGGKKDDILARAEQIRREIETTDSDYDREKLQERLAKLAGGVAEIRCGAATETEMKERKALLEDARARHACRVGRGRGPRRRGGADPLGKGPEEAQARGRRGPGRRDRPQGARLPAALHRRERRCRRGGGRQSGPPAQGQKRRLQCRQRHLRRPVRCRGDRPCQGGSHLAAERSQRRFTAADTDSLVTDVPKDEDEAGAPGMGGMGGGMGGMGGGMPGMGGMGGMGGMPGMM